MSLKQISLLLLMLPLVLASGCYKVALSDIEPGSVYLRGFRNKTYYRNFDEYLNSDLATEISRNGTLALSRLENKADYILSGTISSVFKNVIRTGKDDYPLEYQYVCVLELNFQNTNAPSESIKRTLRRSWRYLPPYGETQESSLKKLSRFLSEELIRAITTKW